MFPGAGWQARLAQVLRGEPTQALREQIENARQGDLLARSNLPDTRFQRPGQDAVRREKNRQEMDFRRDTLQHRAAQMRQQTPQAPQMEQQAPQVQQQAPQAQQQTPQVQQQAPQAQEKSWLSGEAQTSLPQQLVQHRQALKQINVPKMEKMERSIRLLDGLSQAVLATARGEKRRRSLRNM